MLTIVDPSDDLLISLRRVTPQPGLEPAMPFLSI